MSTPLTENDESSSSEEGEADDVPYTITDLSLGQVRWFVRHQNDKHWKACDPWDSLKMEYKYRQTNSISINETSIDEDLVKLCNNEEVMVEDGLYKANVAKRKITPIYWSEDPIELLRGTWFTQNSRTPLSEADASIIEKAYLDKYRNQLFIKLKGKAKAKYPQITVQANGIEVNCYSNSHVTATNVQKRHKLQRLFRRKGTRILRGYPTVASSKRDKPYPIRHLVMCVHGVGSKRWQVSVASSKRDKPYPIRHLVMCVHGVDSKRWQNVIISNTDKVREISELLIKDRYLNIARCRVVFLPVEWRTALELDGGMVEKVTPRTSIKQVRSFVNNTLVDVLYYSSPIYQREINNGVVRELNRLFTLFMHYNPEFTKHGGKVSLLAHSLGSVISYDILTDWTPLHLYQCYVQSELERIESNNKKEKALLGSDESHLRSMYEQLKQVAAKRVQLHSAKQALKFEVECLFCIGSPLGLFLCLRGTNTKLANGLLTKSCNCKRIFNIYSVNDPAAYRLEPLVDPEMAHVSGVPIQLGFTRPKDLKGSSRARSNSAEYRRREDASNRSSSRSRRKSDEALGVWESWESMMKELEKECEDEKSATPSPRSSNAHLSDKTASPRLLNSLSNQTRVDYQLKSARLHNKYLHALIAHYSYWKSTDVISFVLDKLVTQKSQSVSVSQPRLRQTPSKEKDNTQGPSTAAKKVASGSKIA